MCFLYFKELFIAIKIKKKYQGRQRQSDDIIYNEKIKASKVLIIDQNNQNIGEKSIEEALELAYSLDLDLVQVSNKEIPVTRIVDYGKFKYERKKSKQEAKKNQKNVENKEIRITPNIGKADLEVKIKKAIEFLQKGSNVKISLKFKGRQLQNKQIGFDTIDFFLKEIEEFATIDKEPKLSGFFLDAYVSPKKNKK